MHRAGLAFRASLSISLSGHLMLAIVLFLPLVRPLKAISVHADRWIIECADCPKYVMEATDRNLQVDAQGFPHIAYGGDHLYYAWYDGTAWHHETADRSRGVGQYAALALSASGQPHISYYDGLNGNLKYAYRDNVGWHSETIDTGGADTDTGLYTSIAVDSNGYSHISYYDITNRDLKYAFEGAAGWVIETPDSVGDVGGTTSLALGPDLQPQISYCRLQYESSQYVCDALKHAAHGDAGWQIEIVDEEEYPGDHAGAYSSLVVDGTGQPHISYGAWNGVLGSRLKYAYQDAEGWHIEVVDTGSSGFYYTSLSLDGDGYPHISYYDGGRLMYAVRASGDWAVEMIAALGTYGVTSLALDSSAAPYIAFIPADTFELNYAHRDHSGWHVETLVEERRNAGRYNSLALDGEGDPHVYALSYVFADSMSYYASRDALGWHVDELDIVGQTNQNSLTVDLSGYAHVVGITYDGGSTHVTYGYSDLDGWHYEQVAPISDYSALMALALDDSRNVHLAYEGQSSIQYAYHDASGWHTEATPGCGDPAIAIDGAGNPHIGSICEDLPTSLRYVYRDAVGWHYEVVTTSIQSFSLALDTNEVPCFSCGMGSEGLWYTCREDGSWPAEVVDATPYAGNPSLVIDPAGFPHISYYDSTNGDLKYAHKNAEGWHIQTVTHQADGAWYNSLALDTAGTPHISYYDQVTRDLKFAFYVEAGYAFYLPIVIK